MKTPTAAVMNMFYTGLGIARSLSENGVSVLGLSSHRYIYGNFTRHAKVEFCPDSKTDPEGLRLFLADLARRCNQRLVLFPTRDADLLFLDRYRAELERDFVLALPEHAALQVCLDKWETWVAAQRADIDAPRCWRVAGLQELMSIVTTLPYPCLLKPVMAQDWRADRNWEKVGGRKAIPVADQRELLEAYATVSQACPRVLLQELVPGGDERLVVAACYMNRRSEWVAGFNAQKLVQLPEGFGTGCIVQAADRPELFDPTARLLRSIGFNGIAEVEYKWNEGLQKYLLIEINPRPWDQHRLGKACGVDLVYLAYCDLAGLPAPAIQKHASSQKWIAEDAFFVGALRLLWRHDRKVVDLFRRAGGRRTYAIWSAQDPLPLLGYAALNLLPNLAVTGFRAIRGWLRSLLPGARSWAKRQPQPSGLK